MHSWLGDTDFVEISAPNDETKDHCSSLTERSTPASAIVEHRTYPLRHESHIRHPIGKSGLFRPNDGPRR